MRKREIGPEELAELEAFAKSVEGKAVYRRLQCVLLRAKTDWTRTEIADATGYNIRHVERIQSEYFAKGLAAFERKPRVQGGRQYLSPSQEAEFLHSLEPDAEAGKLIGGKSIQLKLVERLQRNVSLSTVYGLLGRHGWKAKRPRPKHPKADAKEQALFKKTR